MAAYFPKSSSSTSSQSLRSNTVGDPPNLGASIEDVGVKTVCIDDIENQRYSNCGSRMEALSNDDGSIVLVADRPE